MSIFTREILDAFQVSLSKSCDTEGQELSCRVLSKKKLLALIRPGSKDGVENSQNCELENLMSSFVVF